MEVWQGIKLTALTKQLLDKYCKDTGENPEDVLQKAFEQFLGCRVIVKTVKKKDREPIEYETVTLKVPRILMEFLYNTPTHYGLNPIPFLEYELVDAIRSDLEATTGEEIIKWNELGSVFYAILEDERYREIGERNGDSTGKP